MQNCPYTNPTGGCPTGSSRWSACKTARTSTRQAGASLREHDFACKTARAPALTTALHMTGLRPGASTSPARSGQTRAHIGAGNKPPGQATEQWKRRIGAGNRPSEQATGHRGRQQSNGNGALGQATGHRGRQFAYPNRRFPTPLPVSCPNTAHRTRKGCTEHPAPP